MTGKPAGSVVGLYIDADRLLEVGDVITTTTGRAYEVLRVRVQQRGKHAGRRQHLRCVVLPMLPVGEVPALVLHWYRR